MQRKMMRYIYIALEDINFTWDEKEVMEFDTLWANGISIVEISKVFQRDTDEVAILAMDRARRGFISNRPGGIFGEAG